jgi:hypothetical protein
MERETGIEPATSSLGSWRSTAELLPLGQRTKLAYHRGGEASTELALAGTGFVSGHRFSDAIAIRITTAARKHPDIVMESLRHPSFVKGAGIRA